MPDRLNPFSAFLETAAPRRPSTPPPRMVFRTATHSVSDMALGSSQTVVPPEKDDIYWDDLLDENWDD